jgi:hypothetical protein
MTFDPNRRAEVFLTAEVAPSQTQRIAPNLDIAATQLHAESFGAGEVPDWVAVGQKLLSESAQLLAWARWNGEGTPGSKWTASQQKYADADRLKLRARAAKLKSDIEARCENPARVLDLIFNSKYGVQYPEELRKQARAELGI